MKNSVSGLSEIYQSQLKTVLADGQRISKCLEKLSSAAFTDEVRTGLSPSSFDHQQHVERFKQCIKPAKSKGAKETDPSVIALFGQADLARKSTQHPSVARDLNLLHSGLKIMNLQQCRYHMLYLMAAALNEEPFTGLLEQSWKDVSNAYGYLLQISSNIIYPALANDPAENLKQKTA